MLWLNDLRLKLSLDGIVRYLQARLREYRIEFNYKTYISRLLKIMAMGHRVEEIVDFVDVYESIVGRKELPAKDERTSEEIIRDTFKKHGIQLVQ